jgi:hypothetical protein
MNLSTMTISELLFTAADLRRVIAAQEDMNRAGLATPKLGQYCDELYAVDAEVTVRRAGKVAA